MTTGRFCKREKLRGAVRQGGLPHIGRFSATFCGIVIWYWNRSNDSERRMEPKKCVSKYLGLRIRIWCTRATQYRSGTMFDECVSVLDRCVHTRPDYVEMKSYPSYCRYSVRLNLYLQIFGIVFTKSPDTGSTLVLRAPRYNGYPDNTDSS